EPPKRWLSIAADRGRVLFGEAEPPDVASDRCHAVASGVLPALAKGPMRQADIARILDRKPSDGTVRRALEQAKSRGEVVRLPDGRWALPESVANPCHGVAIAKPPLGGGNVG